MSRGHYKGRHPRFFPEKRYVRYKGPYTETHQVTGREYAFVIAQNQFCVDAKTSTLNTHNAYGAERTMQVNPGWRDQIRRGVSATTPFKAYGIHTDYVPFYASAAVKSLGCGKTFINIMYGNHLPIRKPADHTDDSTLDAFMATADNAALARVVSKARDAQSKLQTGVVVGEIRETLRMIRSPAKALRRGLSSFMRDAKKVSRKKFKTKKQRQHAFSETWLEHQFGWAPLVSDIMDANTQLQRIGEANYSNIKRVKGTAYTPEKLIVSAPVSGSLANCTLSYTREEVCYGSARYIAGVRVKVKEPLTINPQVLGFIPSTIVPTVWELVPWSFLIDYFTNIGQVLSAWSFPTSDIAWVQRTTRRFSDNRYREVRLAPTTPSVTSVITFMPGKCTTSLKHVIRDPYLGSLVPPLELKIPGTSSLKWLNIAALYQARRGRPP